MNGHKSTQQNIQTLFQSVQLNINNPNFLIMQGRITKVRRDLQALACYTTCAYMRFITIVEPSWTWC